MHEININIKDKKATVDGSPVIVCGNSDYVVNFTLDDEWTDQDRKTARFVYRSKGVNAFQEKIFTGTTCEVPVLYDVDFVLIGVYAGELRTSSPAKVACSPCILDGNPVHDITEDVYHQLLTLFDTRLPADTAWHNVTANALKGTASGEAVTVTDASPIEHEPSVWVHGKNRANIEAMTNNAFVKNTDNLYTLTKRNTSERFSGVIDLHIPPNTPFTISFAEIERRSDDTLMVRLFKRDGTESYIGLWEKSYTMHSPVEVTKLQFYMQSQEADDAYVSVKDFQIELGTEATAYEPYVDPTGVKVTAAGVEFTPGADGSVKGISSADLVGGITTDTAGVTVEVEYNRDVNTVINKLTEAVVALGGTV